MFKPEYRITNYFLSCMDEISRLSERIIQTKIKLPLKLKLQREAFVHNAHSSTSIEGNVLSLPQVSALADQKDISANAKQKIEVLNYLEALRWIIRNKDRAITKNNILSLHQIITKNLLSEERCGIYKTKQNFVINEKNIVIFRPPAPNKIPKMIQYLIEWMYKNEDIHPIIKSSIFHHQFVTIHPFSDGNGRLARVLSQWILYNYNFDPYHIFSLDEYYAYDRKKYYLKIQQARELDYDFTYWIEYVAEGIKEALEKIYKRMQKLALNAKKEILLTPKQVELIETLQAHGPMGSQKLGLVLNVNRARINQLIRPLIKARIIKTEGQARATRYSLTD